MDINNARDAFDDALTTVHDAEQHALPVQGEVTDLAFDDELRRIVQDQRGQTACRLERLDRLFSTLDHQPHATSHAARGLAADAHALVDRVLTGALLNCAVASAAARMARVASADYTDLALAAERAGREAGTRSLDLLVTTRAEVAERGAQARIWRVTTGPRATLHTYLSEPANAPHGEPKMPS